MIGAGTIINPILKIVTTVAILAAVYFFIVKPTLDTTETISSGINENIRQGLGNAPKVPDVPNAEKIQKQIQNSIDSANSAPSAAQTSKLGACMQKAVGDVEAVQACADRFSP